MPFPLAAEPELGGRGTHTPARLWVQSLAAAAPRAHPHVLQCFSKPASPQCQARGCLSSLVTPGNRTSTDGTVLAHSAPADLCPRAFLHHNTMCAVAATPTHTLPFQEPCQPRCPACAGARRCGRQVRSPGHCRHVGDGCAGKAADEGRTHTRLCLAALLHSLAPGKWLDPGEERSKDQTFLGSEVPPPTPSLGSSPSSSGCSGSG